MRLRRSELSTPGSNDKMMAKAAGSDADLVFLDLEDAVAPREKTAARQKVVHALRNLDWGPRTRAIRMNGLHTPYAHTDVIEIVEGAREALDVIILPKATSGRDVWWVDTLLTQIEDRLAMTKKIGIEVLIEEVEGVINAEEIALASPRLEALIFGPGDLSASQGVRLEAWGGGATYPGDIWHYARSKVVTAARAAHIDAIDGPFPAFSNPDGYRQEATWAMELGYVGKWAIHPSQVAIANDVYSPSQAEVDRARRLRDGYLEAEKQGLGAYQSDGEMVDAATVRVLGNTLAKADLIGL